MVSQNVVLNPWLVRWYASGTRLRTRSEGRDEVVRTNPPPSIRRGWLRTTPPRVLSQNPVVYGWYERLYRSFPLLRERRFP